MFSKNINDSLTSWKSGLIYIKNHKWIHGYIYTAIALNILIYLILIVLSFFVSGIFVDFLDQFIANWPDFFKILLSIMIWLVLVVLIWRGYTGLSSVINAPIYSRLLSELLQKEYGESTEKQGFFAEIWSALVFEIQKIILGLAFFIGSLSVNFIPILGTLIHFVLLFIQLIILTGLDAFEPYQSSKKLSFQSRVGEILSKKALYWPFLAVAGLLSLVPFLNIITSPVTIVSACLLMKKD